MILLLLEVRTRATAKQASQYLTNLQRNGRLLHDLKASGSPSGVLCSRHYECGRVEQY